MRLYDLTRLEEAVEAQGDAIAMLRRQMREANQEDLIHSLATALVNQALALMGLGDSDGGMAAFEAAIAAAQSAVDDGERHELGNVLVMALTYKGSALAQVGHLPEGLATPGHGGGHVPTAARPWMGRTARRLGAPWRRRARY